jgi:hypothetical protein
MDQSQKIRNLELKLHALVFLLIVAIIGSAFVFLPNLKNVAQALTGNYNKATGESLNISDWNNLDDDFLDISATNGDNLRMVCGTTGNVWQLDVFAANTVYQEIDLTSYGFSSVPMIFTSLGGSNYHFKAIGGANIYFPSTSGFTIFVTHLSQSVTTSNANSWNWHLNWCAVGE